MSIAYCSIMLMTVYEGHKCMETNSEFNKCIVLVLYLDTDVMSVSHMFMIITCEHF